MVINNARLTLDNPKGLLGVLTLSLILVYLLLREICKSEYPCKGVKFGEYGMSTRCQ